MFKNFIYFTVSFAILHYAGFTRAAETNTDGQPDTNSVAVVMTQTDMSTLDNHQKLGPGDRVMYQVLQDQEPPRTLTVTDSGDLEVPYYGLVHASDKTCRQLAGEIKILLEKKLYYQATVILALEVANKTLISGKVYVTGRVRQPGGFEIPAKENLTVSKAILSAGGFSDFADKKRVKLIRKSSGGESTIVVNVLKIWEGHLDQDVSVQPGDLIVVPDGFLNN
jgi:protein involved in polysaccharide export with SLBB domain